MKPKILIDCNYICYVCLHTMNDLTYNEKKVGIIYCFLKKVLSLSVLYKTNDFYFCWDSIKNYRKIVYPRYKSNREENIDPEKLRERELAYKQFDELRTKILPSLGFKNIYKQNGYESDDLLFKLTKKKKLKGKKIIVTSDEDMYQAINENVSVYNNGKKKEITLKDFLEKYEIRATDWVTVKAIAGCRSDNIKGVTGVGEATAIKFIKNKLDKNSKKYKDIIDNKEQTESNLKLVKLPYDGPKQIILPLRRNRFSEKSFIDVFYDYGFESFLTKKGLKQWTDNFIGE